MRKMLVCWVIVAAGCYTPKKADKQLAKAMNEYPGKVASICKVQYPCKPGKSDTLEKVFYDLIEVECPDYPVQTDTIETKNLKVVTKQVRVPAKEIVITKYIIDSALVKVYQNEYIKCSDEADKWKYKVKSRMNIIWALLALVFFLTGWIVLKYRK